MENIFPYPINYLIILLIEITVFSIFVFIVFYKTKGEVCRRWKASVFIGFIFGNIFQVFILGLGWVGWLMKLNFATFYNDLIGFYNLLIPASLAMASLITTPIIILGTFIAYYRFFISGDALIIKYWQNPKVDYVRDQKSPFQKF